MFSPVSLSDVRSSVTAAQDALRALDLDSMTPDAQAEVLALCEQLERCAHTTKSLAASRVARSPYWKGGRHRSPEEWVAEKTGTSKAEAGRLVETGEALGAAPSVATAAQQGQLSAKQTEAIAGAAAVNPGAADRLLEAARDNDLRGLQQSCRQARADVDPDPEATRRRIHSKRSCRTWTDADGTGHLHVSGPTDEIARMYDATLRRADRMFKAARAQGRREPNEAYVYDGAKELLTSAGGEAPSPPGADAKIIVRVDREALLRGRAIEGETCEIAGVGPVPVSVVDEWMQDAFLAAVITRGETVAGVAHLGRRFRAKQRTAMQWADPVCARKGCSNRLRLEYDHFDDWADTRETTTDSAKRFCRACHRLKSQGWFVSDPHADGKCTFTPPRTAEETRAEIRRQLALLDVERGPPC